MNKKLIYENNETSIYEDNIIKKLPQNLISLNIEKRKPITLDREILKKRKIITNIFNKNFGKSIFGFMPESLEIFKNNFQKFFFNSKSPLLGQSKLLRNIFNKKKKRRKGRSLQSKIDMGVLYFYSLRAKKTKNDVTDTNQKEKYFGLSKNFTTNPSKDIVEYEFFKVKKEDEDNKKNKYYRMYIQNNKDIYSSRNSDSNSEQNDFFKNKTENPRKSSEQNDFFKDKTENPRKSSVLTLTNSRTYNNNYIKIDENDNNIDIKEYNYKTTGKNNTQKNLENLRNSNASPSSFKNRKNLFSQTVTSGYIPIGKLKVNSFNLKNIENNSSPKHNSISYKNVYLLNKPYKIKKNSLNKNLNYLYSNNNNFGDITNHEKDYYMTTYGENSSRLNNLISSSFKKSKNFIGIKTPKKLIFKRNIDNKIVNLNTYTNKCNDKLIKLIDVNKTAKSHKKLFSKTTNEKDKFQVDIKKLLIDKKIKLKKPLKNKSEIKQIFRQAQKAANKKMKKNPKKEKRTFAKQLNRMPDDLALLMADKIFRSEIKLGCKRANEIEKELNKKVRKDKKEIRINKLREITKKNYDHMVYLKNLISYEKDKIFN